MRPLFSGLLLVATCATVFVATAALGGPPRPEVPRPPAVRLPAPEHLSATTRAEVRSRMGRHGNTMSGLVRAVVLLDRSTIATLAGRIADEEVVARVDKGGPDKLKLLLPKEFFTQESTLQSNARDLAAAALNRAPDSVVADHFATVAKTCVSCHSIYLNMPPNIAR